MESPLDRLFKTAKSYIAILDGQECKPSDTEQKRIYLSSATAETTLKALHQTLKEAHPETGAPYWRIRTWGLTCWQPIYLALICVYQLKMVPLGLQHLEQKQEGEMVSGYRLPDEGWQEGSHEECIKLAGEQLNALFVPLQSVHIDSFGGRPALYQGLLADQLMDALMFIGQTILAMEEEQLREDFILWATALKLPLTPLRGLQYKETDQLTFLRQTCCLHFRRNDGSLCQNCPRRHTKKANKQEQAAL